MKYLKKILLGSLVILISGSAMAYGLGYRLVQMSVSASMFPTIGKGDLLLVKQEVGSDQLRRGDIVLISGSFFNIDYPLTKRIMATEGERLTIQNDSVFIDDRYLEEPYAYFDASRKANAVEGSWYTAKGELFVMGDNRNNSMDSRYPEFGMVAYKYVLAKLIWQISSGTNR